MFRFPKTLSSLTSLFLIASVLFASTSAAQSKFDMTVPASYGLGPCKSAIDTDCIESVEVAGPSGQYVFARYLEGPSDSVLRVDEYNEPVYDNRSLWATPFGDLPVVAQMSSPEKRILTASYGGGLSIGLDLSVKPVFKTLKYRVIMRESWLRPVHVALNAIDSRARVVTFQGGRRWIFEGRPRTNLGYNNYVLVDMKDSSGNTYQSVDWSKKADFEDVNWYVGMAHADSRPGYGYWPEAAPCADKGFTITSSNATGAGNPFWDVNSNSLNFSISAPAYKVDGSRNLGFFYFSTTHTYLDCAFKGNTFGNDTKLILEIIAEDGTTKVATTSITNTSDRLEFFASGFTYSSPKIVLREARSGESSSGTTSTKEEQSSTDGALSPSPSPTPSGITGAVVSKMIVCLKGKTTRALSEGKKKCPKGWKKKIG